MKYDWSLLTRAYSTASRWLVKMRICMEDTGVRFRLYYFSALLSSSHPRDHSVSLTNTPFNGGTIPFAILTITST